MNDGIKIAESKKVTLTAHGAKVLGEHALGLPVGDPARAQIMLLLGRYDRADVVKPRLEAVAA
jgi:hypothetical protein